MKSVGAKTWGRIGYALWALALVYAAWNISWSYFSVRWTNNHLVREVGLVGYLTFDVVNTAAAAFDDIEDVDPAPYVTWLKARHKSWRDKLPPMSPNKKNLIFLQLESVDYVTIDADHDGKPAMPFLRSLRDSSLFFEEAVDQTGVGRSSDAHILALTSQMPIQNQAVFTRFDLSEVMSLPRILKPHGYRSISFEGYHGEFWRWKTNHARMGYDESFSMEDLNTDEMLGWGISDSSVVRQALDEATTGSRPFFAHIVLLTHHHPFRFVRNRQSPEGKGIVSDYLISARYVDSVIEELFERLDSEGLRESTVVAVYSDHDSGIVGELNAYRGLPVSDRVADERITMLVAGSDVNKQVHTAAGLLDLAPTVLTALGIETPWSFVGMAAQAGPSDVLLQNGTRVAPDGSVDETALPIDLGTLTRLAIERPEALSP